MCAEVLLFQRHAFWVLGFRRLCFFLELAINDWIQVVVEIWKCIFYPVFSGLWIWVPEIISLCTLRIAKEFVHFENYPLFFWVILGLENRINLSSRFWNSSKEGRSKNIKKHTRGMLNKPASPWWEFLSNGKALADESSIVVQNGICCKTVQNEALAGAELQSGTRRSSTSTGYTWKWCKKAQYSTGPPHLFEKHSHDASYIWWHGGDFRIRMEAASSVSKYLDNIKAEAAGTL